MGLLSFFSKQFIDVIQWTETNPGVLAYRFPMQDMEIQNGGKLIVRETQQAIFLNEGKFADKFSAGTYTLNTQNLPILTDLKNWDKFFESPFKSDVYFFSLREQLDQKWGTAQPITIRDKEFGVIRLRAFGNYSYVIEDVQTFWSKLCGTAQQYTIAEIDGQLRGAILTAISDFMAKSEVAFLDMAANQVKFSEQLKDAVAPVLKNYGLSLRTFFVQNLSLPEELQKHLDRVSSIRMVGDLQKYAQFQAADAITEAAQNSNGAAGAGMGIGAGFMMSQMMANNNSNSGATNQVEDPIKTLEKLGELLKNGVLTQSEFDAKKAEILAKIK